MVHPTGWLHDALCCRRGLKACLKSSNNWALNSVKNPQRASLIRTQMLKWWRFHSFWPWPRLLWAVAVSFWLRHDFERRGQGGHLWLLRASQAKTCRFRNEIKEPGPHGELLTAVCLSPSSRTSSSSFLPDPNSSDYQPVPSGWRSE